MSEILFSVKTFAISILIILFLQMQIADKSIETHMQNKIQDSKVALWIQSAAIGGALLLEQTALDIKNKVLSLKEESIVPKKAQK
jgi:hypothetical protein